MSDAEMVGLPTHNPSPTSFDQWHHLLLELRVQAGAFRDAQAQGRFSELAQDLYDFISDAATVAYLGTLEKWEG